MTKHEVFAIISALRAARLVLVLFATTGWACVAHSQPTGFVEEFDGPTLDPVWNQNGDPDGHPTTIAGTYDITDAHGSPGTTLNRSTGGTVSSFTHEVEFVLDPHLLTGSGGTRSDIKFRSVGPDGNLSVVFNSFGHLRVDHADFNTGSSDHIAGASPDNITIGYSDGDALNLKVDYDDATDTIDVTYALNGGSDVSVYSGSGIDGAFGDVITTSVEFLVFKFGDAVPDQTLASIDSWSLVETTNGLPGDFDADDDVDGLDFLAWQQNPAIGSLTDWETNYGTPPMLTATATVPEPSGMLLVLSSTAMLGRSRGNRRRH
jgi:hypothetical protein